ncbi:hypothetical protein GCM10020331_006710 [Ectobacillus funiculus]
MRKRKKYAIRHATQTKEIFKQYHGTGSPLYKEASSLYVRIEIISYSQLHTEWHRSDAYD